MVPLQHPLTPQQSHYLQLRRGGQFSWGTVERVPCRGRRPCRGRWTECAPGCTRTWWTCRALPGWTSPGRSRRTRCADRSPSGPPGTWCEPANGSTALTAHLQAVVVKWMCYKEPFASSPPLAPPQVWNRGSVGDGNVKRGLSVLTFSTVSFSCLILLLIFSFLSTSQYQWPNFCFWGKRTQEFFFFFWAVGERWSYFQVWLNLDIDFFSI